jgi:hypothetical protein
VLEPLRFAFDLDCTPEHAFAVWVDKTNLWWPATHTVSEAPGVRVIFEPRDGGRIFERTPSGQEHEWGHITGWDPPVRLAYTWRIRVDLEHATDVEIRFAPREPGGTRVEIEHRGWERLGDFGPGWRDANRGGWDGVLPAYIAAANAAG